MITSFGSLLYTAEGEQVARLLWRETMHEFSIAGVDDIVKAFNVV